MAKSGSSSTVVGRDSSRSVGHPHEARRRRDRDAQGRGIRGVERRAIAERAGLNQGLIFYHFGSVANLCWPRWTVSARRMEHYGAAIDRVRITHRAGRRGDGHLPGGSRRRLRRRPRRDDRRGIVDARVGRRSVRSPRSVVRLRRAGGDHHARAAAGLGGASRRRGVRDRRALPRARDADAPRRGPGPSARPLRPCQESGAVCWRPSPRRPKEAS